MSYTLNENGIALTETRDGVTMPVDCSFEKVNDWIHGIDVQFEELQALCLGMSAENDRLRDKLKHSDDWNESLGAAIESAAGYLSCSDSGFKAGVNSYSALHEMQDLIQRTIDFALDVPECGCSHDACSSCARYKEAQGLVSELKTYLEVRNE